MTKNNSSEDITEYHDDPKVLNEKLDELAELLQSSKHVELCNNCNCEYLRTFRCRNAEHVHDHKTGRMCDKCGNELEDSIINFGENLPEDQLDRALLNAKKADLAIVLGTSLRVSPACDLPEMCLKMGGKMVIVNLQKTPKDNKSSLRIFAKTDDVINGVMQRLSLSIPSYVLKSEFTLATVEKQEKSLLGNIRRKIGMSLTSPIKGARLLSELEIRLVCEKKILKYTTPTIDEIPQDCKQVIAKLTYNVDPKHGKDAICELMLENPLTPSSKTYSISVDTADNSVTVIEKL